ncbi:MAG: ParB/RepB/Spo0J family partition protein [Chlorobi bacterium]|nr:ParB/RepB/Spo0J family partition protein [Chlorobiota bacterium]
MAKTNKKQRLGRGLDALLKSDKVQSASDSGAKQIIGNIIEIPVDRIQTNPYQPRTQFDEEALRELASSIKELGIIQPITVRKEGRDKFIVISGERRLRAAKMAGLDKIPAYVRLANDREMLEMALVENLQREDLDPIEVALSFRRMIEELGLTQEEMSERVGKKRSTITNYLRLLKLDPIIQSGIRDGFIGMGHGRALINIEDPDVQLDIYKIILEKKLSVRQTEELVRQYREGKILEVKPKTKKPAKPGDVKWWEKQLRQKIHPKTSVRWQGDYTGKIVIPFSNREEWEKLLSLLQD